MLAGLSTNWLTLAVSSLGSLGDDQRLTAAQGHGYSLTPVSLEVHGGPFVSFVRFSPLARLGGIFLTPPLRVPGICHAARACGGPWGRVVDPGGLLGKAPGAAMSRWRALRLRCGLLAGCWASCLIER